MKILSCIESYLPGTHGGGVVRALTNMVEQLKTTHDFSILTRNHDYLRKTPYAEIKPNRWQEQSAANYCYAEDDQWVSCLLQTVSESPPDWLYLQGALSPMTRRILSIRRRHAELRKIPILLAPHGNLGPGTLQHHAWRKQAWLAYAKLRGLYRNLHWHAASEREAAQIQAIFGPVENIRVVPMAPSLEALLPQQATNNEQQASSNSLRLVYFGRLSPEKNLEFAFRLLAEFAARHTDQRIIYDLIGSGEPRYEAKLRSLSAKLPNSVRVNFLGQLPSEALQVRLQEGINSAEFLSAQLSTSNQQTKNVHYHAMLMPSLTENFSYTVLESFQAGLPVLISDQTPWRDLTIQRLGWDLSLDQPGPWGRALEALADQSEQARIDQSEAIRCFAQKWVAEYPQQANRLFQRSSMSTITNHVTVA